MKTYFIQTLGCKVNRYESDGIAGNLQQKGWVKSKDKSGADVYIVNTCAVTSKAGMQSRQAIRKIIRENPDAKVIVTGCHVQTDPDQINTIEHIDQVVCHKDKFKIAEQITAICEDQTEFTFKPVDHSHDNQFFGFDQPVTSEMTRAYLKIQDGCESFCTYCIVPYARGSSVSMPENEVLDHLKGLNNAGYREVILTGIHTGLYGLDLKPETSLSRVVKKADDQKLVDRIRLSSIEPKEIDDDLIALAGPDHILCNHFHIPLQSGDDAILKSMKRPYSTDFFKNIVLKIVGKVPDVGIGIDVIVGFPGETEKQFQNTYDFIRSLPVSYLHVFPFSARKGTPAFHFQPKVNSAVIKDRTKILRDLDKIKRKEFILTQMNKPLQGLVQHKPDKQSGLLKAVTSNYLTVMIKNKQGLQGKTLDLKIKHCHKDLTLTGERIL